MVFFYLGSGLGGWHRGKGSGSKAAIEVLSTKCGDSRHSDATPWPSTPSYVLPSELSHYTSHARNDGMEAKGLPDAMSRQPHPVR